MNKQELIEAIEETLASNGNKAITADALKALLLAMVDSIGEGGQGGGITLQVGLDSSGNYSVTPNAEPEPTPPAPPEPDTEPQEITQEEQANG